MNKRLVITLGGLTFLIGLTFILILVNDNHLYELEDLRPPNRISSYQENRYFKIDPETILASLESGELNVFAPLQEEDAINLEPIPDLSIYWTQADFLMIASAAGQIAWHDPMDLKKWNVNDIFFYGSCVVPISFDFASVTYFKIGKNNYVTRFIVIDPSLGLVRLGDNATYPQPILQKWKSVDLLGSKISADNALRIINEDLIAHFQIKDNICGVMMGSSRYDPYNWDLRINRGSLDPIFYYVNRDTGRFVVRR